LGTKPPSDRDVTSPRQPPRCRGFFMRPITSNGVPMQTAAIAFLAVVAAVNGVLVLLAVRAFVAGLRGSVDSFADWE